MTERYTAETQICLSLEIKGSGEAKVDSGCGFLNHMLTLFTRHGGFDLQLKASGDTDVDYHHTVEDVGICLGRELKRAMGEKRGIVRYGSILLPMDEALILCAVDVSGRGGFYGELAIPTEKDGDFDTQLCEEFFIAFARESGITIHLRQIAGCNSHHIIEACFKAAGRALKAALSLDAENPDAIPSTKGILA